MKRFLLLISLCAVAAVAARISRGTGSSAAKIRLKTTLVTPNDVELSWSDPVPGAAGHTVEWTMSPDHPYTILDFLPPGQTTYRHSDLMPRMHCYYRVRAFYGPASTEVGVSLPKTLTDRAYVAAFAKPENYQWAAPQTVADAIPVVKRSVRTSPAGGPIDFRITLMPITVSAFKLRWTDRASDAEGYMVEVKPADASEFRVRAIVPPGTNSFGWAFVPPERSASLRVRAYYYGEPSNTAEEITGPDTPGGKSTPAGIQSGRFSRSVRFRELQDLLRRSPETVLAELKALTQTQPAAAIDFAQALGRNDQERYDWVVAVTHAWADRDPQAAWDWLTELSAGRMAELAGGDLTGVILRSMAYRDPGMVAATADDLLREGNSSQSVPTAVAVHVSMQALVEGGAVELAREMIETWAKDPGNLPIEAAAFETVADALSGTDPAGAGRWLLSLPASDDRNAAVAGFCADWAASDPGAALQWAETLTPDQGQQAAMCRTVSDWVERSPQEVSEWLGQYLAQAPADGRSDQLVEILINLSPIAQDSPMTALHWADLIADSAQREAYQEKTVLRWESQDPAAALAYLRQAASIPPDRKAALLREWPNVSP